MPNRFDLSRVFFVIAWLSLSASFSAQSPTLAGTFVVDGADAKLTQVRVARFVLDEKTKETGYAILMSAKPATGDIKSWQTADPARSGSFVFLVVEPSGAVWIAELGHAARKDGRFGVVTELKKVSFEVKGNRLSGHYRTNGEQTFSGTKFTIDLQFSAAIEGQ